MEKLFPDGRREIKFGDGTVKCVHPNGEEESVFADGTVQRLMADGNRVIEYGNGQKETHTKDYKVSSTYHLPYQPLTPPSDSC